jgi:hypothetical protein
MLYLNQELTRLENLVMLLDMDRFHHHSFTEMRIGSLVKPVLLGFRNIHNC